MGPGDTIPAPANPAPASAAPDNPAPDTMGAGSIPMGWAVTAGRGRVVGMGMGMGMGGAVGEVRLVIALSIRFRSFLEYEI